MNMSISEILRDRTNKFFDNTAANFDMRTYPLGPINLGYNAAQGTFSVKSFLISMYVCM